MYEKHLFICTFGKDCKETNAQEVFEKLKSAFYAKYPQGINRITRSGCLGKCGQGPACVIYPEGQWHTQIDISQCQSIIDSIKES